MAKGRITPYGQKAKSVHRKKNSGHAPLKHKGIFYSQACSKCGLGEETAKDKKPPKIRLGVVKGNVKGLKRCPNPACQYPFPTKAGYTK
jgi:hypothetical protein